MRTHHVEIIAPEQARLIAHRLEEDGFRMGSAPHASFEAAGDEVRITFYPKRRKLLIQGNGTDAFLLRYRDLIGGAAAPPSPRDEVREPTIGSDESGKGDYFGSLVVAGCMVRPEDVSWIRKLGIRDSKEAAQHTIMMAEGRILDRLPTAVVEFEPEDYGRRHATTGNVNRILGDAHAEVIRRLLAKHECRRAVVDRFGGEHYVRDALGEKALGLSLLQVPRAESHPAVACASFLARAAFVRSLARLSDEVGVDLLPGASAEVERCARKIVKVGGAKLLAKVAKMHFKTTARVLP